MLVAPPRICRPHFIPVKANTTPNIPWTPRASSGAGAVISVVGELLVGADPFCL